jgi:hypothetical protein
MAEAGAEAVVTARGRVLLVNPTITSRRRARFPLSLMTIAAGLEGRFDSVLIAEVRSRR